MITLFLSLFIYVVFASYCSTLSHHILGVWWSTQLMRRSVMLGSWERDSLRLVVDVLDHCVSKIHTWRDGVLWFRSAEGLQKFSIFHHGKWPHIMLMSVVIAVAVTLECGRWDVWHFSVFFTGMESHLSLCHCVLFPPGSGPYLYLCSAVFQVVALQNTATRSTVWNLYIGSGTSYVALADDGTGVTHRKWFLKEILKHLEYYSAITTIYIY